MDDRDEYNTLQNSVHNTLDTVLAQIKRSNDKTSKNEWPSGSSYPQEYTGHLQTLGQSKRAINLCLKTAEQYHQSLDTAFSAPALRLRVVGKKVLEVLTSEELDTVYTNF